MRRFYGLATGVSFLLLACSGDYAPSYSDAGSTATSGASSPPNSAPQISGLWQGTMHSGMSGDSRQLIGLMDYDGWGSNILVTTEGQFHGLIPTVAHFTAELTGIARTGSSWADGSTVGDFVFDGELASGEAGLEINGEYSGAGDFGTFSLAFDPISRRGSDVQRVAGLWALRDSSQNIIATFEITASDSRADMTGSDMDGCLYSGVVEGDPWYSIYIYPVFLTVENCPIAAGSKTNGDYEGAGAVTDIVVDSKQDDQFLIAVRYGDNIITLTLEKL